MKYRLKKDNGALYLDPMLGTSLPKAALRMCVETTKLGVYLSPDELESLAEAAKAMAEGLRSLDTKKPAG